MNIQKYTVIFLLLCGLKIAADPQEKIDYIKSVYEKTVDGKPYLFFPATQPQRLVVIFNGATKGIYRFWRWFWQEDEAWQSTAYLFLRDDEFGWYLGIGKESFVASYKKIITQTMNELGLTAQQVVTFGGSMGGYGALYYAITMKLKGAVLFNPQIDYESAQLNDGFDVNVTGFHWRDLDQLAEKAAYLPCISLTYGLDKRDVSAAQKLIEVLKKRKATCMIHSTRLPGHAGVSEAISKAFVEQELAYVAEHHALEHKK